MPNENCLRGIKCPKCNNEDSFKIAVTKMVLMTDDGSEDTSGDEEWNGDSYIECTECGASGKVEEFRPASTKESKAAVMHVVQVAVPSTRTLRFEVRARNGAEAIALVKEQYEKGKTPDIDFGITEDPEAAEFDVIEVRDVMDDPE